MRKEQEAKGWLRKALSGEHSRPTGNPAVLCVVLRSTTASPFPPSLTFIPVIFGLPPPPHITPYFFPSKTIIPHWRFRTVSRSAQIAQASRSAARRAEAERGMNAMRSQTPVPREGDQADPSSPECAGGRTASPAGKEERFLGFQLATGRLQGQTPGGGGTGSRSSWRSCG